MHNVPEPGAAFEPLIEPVKRGADLLDEMEKVRLRGDQLALWWLGQSGFVVKWRGALVFIDPYLSEHLTAKYAATPRPHVRMTRAPFRASDVRRADLVLSTHKHSDHLDPGTIPELMRRAERASLVLPRPLVEHAVSMGVDRERLAAAEPGRQLTFRAPGGAAFRVHPVPSAHEKLDFSEDSGYPYLGYVLEFGSRSIYHSGDCVPWEGLADCLRAFRLDAVLLPINGRDPARGVPGNFTVEEAAALAEAVGAEWLAPMHYDMFTFNTVDVSGFVRHVGERHPRQKFRVLKCGELWVL